MKNTFLILLCLLTIGCKITSNENLAKIENLEAEVNRLEGMVSQAESISTDGIVPFMTFQKADAEQAMNFYISLFDNSKIVELSRWGKDAPGKEGTIMMATFSLNGKLFKCSDSPPVHSWDFSPAISNYLDCKNDEQIESLFKKLSENGQVFMPLNNYGFSQKFGWVVDQFGVSWQLNLL